MPATTPVNDYAVMANELQLLRDEVRQLREEQAAMIAVVTKVAEEVKPMVEQVSQGGLMTLLGFGGKR